MLFMTIIPQVLGNIITIRNDMYIVKMLQYLCSYQGTHLKIIHEHMLIRNVNANDLRLLFDAISMFNIM
jgi:hypothetical protein